MPAKGCFFFKISKKAALPQGAQHQGRRQRRRHDGFSKVFKIHPLAAMDLAELKVWGPLGLYEKLTRRCFIFSLGMRIPLNLGIYDWRERGEISQS